MSIERLTTGGVAGMGRTLHGRTPVHILFAAMILGLLFLVPPTNGEAETAVPTLYNNRLDAQKSSDRLAVQGAMAIRH